METDGRDTNRAGRSGGDNVVPFPRDWIGPLDDLVPFGSAADDGGDPKELGSALVADSFWSASSASLHQVVEAPPESRGESARQGEPVGATSRRQDRARESSRSRLRRFRVARLAAAVAVAMVAVTLALETGSGVPTVHRHGTALAAGLGESVGVTSTASRESARLSHLLVTRAIERTSRRSGKSHRSATHHHPAARATVRPSSVGTAAHVAVSYDVTPPTPVTPAGGSAGASSDESAPSVQTNTGTASGAGASSSKAGPSGPGAPFGPGQLNGG